MSDDNSDVTIEVEPDTSNDVENTEQPYFATPVKSSTHTGIERKAGGWLEEKCNDILEFAGFETEREVKIPLIDGYSEHFKIDVLAKYDNLTIFLESKAYADMKIDSKLIFTLIGQINHYRLKHPEEKVIGIFATSAKNVDGINDGIAAKLESEGCYLWDGFKIDDMTLQITKLRNGELFKEYVFDELEYYENQNEPESEDPTLKLPRFFCRVSFYSIRKIHYIGNEFHVTSIIGDLKSQLEDTAVNLMRTKYDYFADQDNKSRLHFLCDFEMTKTSENIREHALKNQGSWFSRNKMSSSQLMISDFTRACKKALENTYGIESEFDINYPSKIITTRIEHQGNFIRYNSR